MQGQYKVPGGKLVVADFRLQDQRLQDVRISGDFFLEPDEALEAINHALEGLPADSSGEAIITAIEACLPAGTVMFGFDAAAIATTIRRALAAGQTA